MIRRLSYVACDECGGPAEVADDAKEARALARGQGFVRRDRRDLCPHCAGRHGMWHGDGRWEDLPQESEASGA